MSNAASMVECLETRQLFAGASVVHDTLMVSGNGGATNTMVITETAADSVDVDITSVTRRNVTKHFTASFPKALFYTSVQVRGGALDDTITFVGADGQPGSFTLPVHVNAYAGNDTVTAGVGDDDISTGGGDDVIHAGAGNDTVRGRQGNDQLFGEDGNDTLWGGLGDDRVEGGDGNDTLGGILGANTLLGGDGTDLFVVRSIEANPDNDYTNGIDALRIKVAGGEETSVPHNTSSTLRRLNVPGRSV